MKIRDIIRILVVKTNPYWPFSFLNKIPYYLVIRVFVLICKKFPEIKSVYLRHGLTEGNWVPGISDIDLTVIIDSKLNLEEEYSFLNKFWKNYRRLKMFFPKLGEVEILNEEHIQSWTKLTIRGYESRNWKLLYGEHLVKSNYVLNPTRLAIDSLNYGLWKYSRFFLENFYKQGSSYLVLQEMRRLVSKLLTYSSQYNPYLSIRQKNSLVCRSKAEMLYCIIIGLEESMKSLPPSDTSSHPGKNAYEWMDNIVSRLVNSEKQTVDLRKLICFREEIESVILSRNVNFIVLKDGLDESAITKCLESIRKIFSNQSLFPLIVSKSIFNYMIRIYDPYLYTSLVSERSVPFGRDILFDIQLPDTKFFINKLLEQSTLTLLAFPQSQTVVSPSGSTRLTEPELNSILKRFLFLKLYLEKGIVKPFYRELLAECQKYYPVYYSKIEELKKNTNKNRNGYDSIEWFRFLKDMANDVHNSLSHSSITEDLFKTEYEDTLKKEAKIGQF